MSTTAVQDFRDTGPRLLRLDPLLLLATLGLVAASVYTVRRATLGDIPGDPNYYMDRQLIYIGVGLVLPGSNLLQHSTPQDHKYGLARLGPGLGLVSTRPISGNIEAFAR